MPYLFEFMFGEFLVQFVTNSFCNVLNFLTFCVLDSFFFNQIFIAFFNNGEKMMTHQ